MSVPSIPILKYHNLIKDGVLRGETPDQVLDQLRNLLSRLRKRFDICSLSECIHRIESGEKNVIALTFDDSYQIYASEIAGLLRNEKASATFYVCSAICDSGESMWNDRLYHCIYKNIRVDYLSLNELLRSEGLSLAKVHPINDETVISSLLSTLKYTDLTGRDQALSALETAFGISSHERVEASLKLSKPATIEDIKSIARLGMEVGGHTLRHPILSMESEHVANEQIQIDRRRLGDILGKAPESFAYPNGVFNDDFLPKHVSMVKAAGYNNAVSATYGISKLAAENRFTLKRIEIPLRSGNYRMLRFLLKSRLA